MPVAVTASVVADVSAVVAAVENVVAAVALAAAAVFVQLDHTSRILGRRATLAMMLQS